MDKNAEDNPNLSGLAASMRADFRLLVATLSNEIESLDDPGPDMLAALRNAKFVAERGLQLSECLANTIDGEAA